LLDLIRFVSELGKPGPFAARSASTVSRWKVLHEVPPALADGVPNLDVLRETVLRAGPDAWDTTYSLLNGSLPLTELNKSGVIYLQADVQIVQAGPVELQLTAPGSLAFWVDDQAFEKQKNATVTLTPGRHRITVRVAPGEAAAPLVRLDLHKPANSKAHFELVMGE
jgi:hypothetical protein